MFQVISRNNNADGPYRLIIEYNSNGAITTMSEARCTSPDYVKHLRNTVRMAELPALHVTDAEYEAFKRWCIPEHITIRPVT